MFYTDPIILPWVWSQINHWLPQTHPTIVSYSVLLTTLNNFYTNQLLSLKQNFVGLQYIYIFATCVCDNGYKEFIEQQGICDLFQQYYIIGLDLSYIIPRKNISMDSIRMKLDWEDLTEFILLTPMVSN